MRYEERMIDEVQSLNDIVEVISSYIPLKRSGRTFKALCPFHQEKTPSFNVHPEKQIYHCFGCGVGGNVFSFLMKYENLTFPEALRNLAGRVNFALPEPTQRSTEEVSESEGLYEAYRLAQEYYSNNLKHPEKGQAARTYLKKRGFEEDILQEFPLGWATPEWRGLFEFLTRRGVKDTVIYRSGLALRSREGNPYDLFRGRILFPIHNLQGKVIAFGGRGIGDEMPKYLNSSESAIFRKRKELFGLHLAKRFLSREDSKILIVEGYFDFLRVYRSGFPNVAATLGTALTEDHVRVLKRFTHEAVFIYDGDQAGQAASLRGLEVFLEGEMSIKIVVLPQAKDPDSFILDKGPEEFRKLLDTAQDFFDFKWNYLRHRYDPSDSAGLLKISTEFIETLSKIKSSLLLDRYMKKLAKLLGVGEASLRNELVIFQQKIRSRERSIVSQVTSKPLGNEYPEEWTLISLLLEEPSFWEKEGTSLSSEDFKHPRAREVFQILERLTASGKEIGYSQVFNRLEEESVKSFIAAYSLTELTQKDKEKAFSDCLRKLKQRRVEERLEKLRQAIVDAEEGGEKGKVTELLQEYRLLLTQKG
ncbi:MAG: DNA primase [Candidatus Omnitrophica bacterium]|nr:DNA primase [Candidatus Omnitrophota bacterium]